MNIQQFRYVLAVAEHRHFETAAEKCFISQSTLSTMILKFEEEIGITIFDRKKRPMEITQEGEKIIEQLHIISNEISNLEELSKEIKGELKGVIKIACIPTVAPFLLPRFLVDFAYKYPEITIEVSELTTEEIVRQLKLRDLDIGIVSTPLNESELTEYPLYDEPFVLYETTSKEVQKGTAISKINMNNFWLMEEEHCMRSQVLNICNQSNDNINSSFNINFKASSIDSLIRFVKANKGRTLLPFLATTDFSVEDQKHIRNLSRPVPFRTIGLLTHQHFPKNKILHLLQQEINHAIRDVKTLRCYDFRMLRH
ncbi:MAG TPA: LysR substrate-binding domain-containing protein [Crocinitomicaceae bacterium]|nr:LysR substrate-binding domain-containing protein [Crocinitomicaceae bacterium]